jgi:hypothetical protein
VAASAIRTAVSSALARGVAFIVAASADNPLSGQREEFSFWHNENSSRWRGGQDQGRGRKATRTPAWPVRDRLAGDRPEEGDKQGYEVGRPAEAGKDGLAGERQVGKLLLITGPAGGVGHLPDSADSSFAGCRTVWPDQRSLGRDLGERPAGPADVTAPGGPNESAFMIN